MMSFAIKNNVLDDILKDYGKTRLLTLKHICLLNANPYHAEKLMRTMAFQDNDQRIQRIIARIRKTYNLVHLDNFCTTITSRDANCQEMGFPACPFPNCFIGKLPRYTARGYAGDIQTAWENARHETNQNLDQYDIPPNTQRYGATTRCTVKIDGGGGRGETQSHTLYIDTDDAWCAQIETLHQQYKKNLPKQLQELLREEIYQLLDHHLIPCA